MIIGDTVSIGAPDITPGIAPAIVFAATHFPAIGPRLGPRRHELSSFDHPP